MMPVLAQILNAPDKNWIVFIKDDAFDTLYDVYIRNFDVQNKQRKEYSVLWFRQMWKKLNDLASRNHSFTSSVEDIENSYHASSPPYGQIQFEAKIIYSRKDFKYYNVLIIDSFNYTIPYTDIYGGRRVIIEQIHNTMNNTKKRIRLTESQLHNIIKESVKNLFKEETYEFDDAQLFPQAVELAIELSDALRKIKIDTYGEKTVCIPIQQFSYIEDMSSQLHEIMHQLEEQSAFPRN